MIRILLLSSLFLIAGYVAFSRNSAGLKAGLKGLFILILLLGSLAVVHPELTTEAAHAVGVGRGTDLLLYVLTIVVLTSNLRHYLERKKLERREAVLVKSLALVDRRLEELCSRQELA